MLSEKSKEDFHADHVILRHGQDSGPKKTSILNRLSYSMAKKSKEDINTNKFILSHMANILAAKSKADINAKQVIEPHGQSSNQKKAKGI